MADRSTEAMDKEQRRARRSFDEEVYVEALPFPVAAAVVELSELLADVVGGRGGNGSSGAGSGGEVLAAAAAIGGSRVAW